MNSAQRHLKSHPHARPSTLRLLEKKDRTTEQLRAEIEAQNRVNQFRGSIGYRPAENALTVIVGKLRALARELVS